MEYREHMVPRGRYRIYTKDYPGEKPAIVLMYGFPDNLHLYDRLVPRLSSRRVVVFDFLGWGRSDKPEGYPYTADNQTRDLGRLNRAPRARKRDAGRPRRLGTAGNRLGAGAPGQDRGGRLRGDS